MGEFVGDGSSRAWRRPCLNLIPAHENDSHNKKDNNDNNTD